LNGLSISNRAWEIADIVALLEADERELDRASLGFDARTEERTNRIETGPHQGNGKQGPILKVWYIGNFTKHF